jgi:probable HAF family extracellular repeat protein
MVGLGDLPGGEFHSEARAVSGDGRVVVGSSNGATGIEAFRWTPEGGMVALGDVPGGDVHSMALATTADGGLVVGESRASLVATPRAFIWTESGGMRDLQDVLTDEYGLGPALAGWDLYVASDVSDDGRVIVGYGSNPAGELEGFVVIVPEPSAAVLAVAISATLFAGRRRRSR